ncbi:MAG: elongation factor P [Erysipelotrichaceae bacterium]
MVTANDIKSGNSIIYEGNIYLVLDSQHNKTAMRQMIIKVKVKNMRTGSTVELSFTGGEKVELAHIDKKEMQYLYDAGAAVVFMDTDTYEQIEINKENLEWELNFLKANAMIQIQMYNGEILGVILPDKMPLQIVECEPAVKGDTATNALKNAVLETGLNIKVPMFINNEEVVLVSTADGKYSSRA